MKKQVSLAAVAVATAISATAAQAEEVKISGKVFYDYSSQSSTVGATTTKTSGGNISRTYLTAQKKLDDTWSAKVTFDSALDSNLAAAGSKANNVFLKIAQLTGSFSDEVNVKLGMISTPWIGYADGLNGHRYIAKSYVDQQKLDSSADAGIGVFGKVGMISYDVVSVNGGGYGNTTKTDATDINLRVGASPIEHLTVDFGYRSGYKGTKGSAAAGGGNDTDNTLTQIMATYGLEVNGLSYRAGLNIINNKADDKIANTSTTLKGQELWVWARQGDIGGFIRYESTDTGAPGSATEKRTVLALDYHASKDVTFSLVSDSTTDTGGVSGNKASATGVFSQFKF